MNTSATSPFSLLKFYYSCASSTKGIYIFTAWFVLYLALFPLFLLVLYIGFTKWRKQCSSVTVSVSHCDAFAFHMTAQEILLTAAAVLSMFVFYCEHYGASASGTALFCFTLSVQGCLHSLTCVDRYLAVVHPITYLHLKRRGGAMIRNVSIAVVWLLGVVYMVILISVPNFFFVLSVHTLWVSVAMATVIFCSVSVLRVLIRPGPGERDKNRMRIDKSKLSAFTTIMAILGVLLVRLVQLFVLNFWPFLPVEPCVSIMTTFWFSLPSSLVLPLLFLHREGKLFSCC